MMLQRRLSAAVTLAYVIGYFLAFAHITLERHVECLEHHTAHHAAEATTEQPSSTGPHFGALPVEQDDHCEIFEIIRTQSPSVAASAVVGLLPENPLEPTTTALAEVSSDHVGRQVWRLAPKQSPPISI